MQPICLEALRIPITEGVSLRLVDEVRSTTSAFSVTLPLDYTAVLSERSLEAPKPGDRPPFFYDATAPERGLNALRIFEMRDYLWELECAGDPPELIITSSLEQSEDRNLWRARQRHGRFRFENFLGAAWIEVAVTGCPARRISFEVASPKLDYEQEYRSMVESIGAECQQLLIEWGTPTTLNLTSDPVKRAQTLLEQFIFLRHVLGPDRLDLYLETIQRQPHSRLQSERDWKPAGAANPSLFLRDPLRYGRGWNRNGGILAADELREERRYDSLDTPPNRFLKFALQEFRNLCDEVLRAKNWPPDSPVQLEAVSLQHSLDSFLALPVFNDVGELQRIPFESTVLQRREGYREILQAWLMLDAAAQIDWPGREDAYKGNSRNVAALYEYWLYFVLVRVFRDKLKMQPQCDPLARTDGALPFCCRADDGRLVINLKQREASFCRFRWCYGGHELAVHFFYNRRFARTGVGARGSYSGNFRPDYTLVIIPGEYAGEKWLAAEKASEADGLIAYLHFDAKYRGENLPGIFGFSKNDADDKELDQTKASGTAKNDDIYKMHTYNEAIRRTIGSYVLYPGDDPKNELNANRFERYHELIPGVGAFALRPPCHGADTEPVGVNCLVEFIEDILRHQLNKFTQSHSISRWTEDTIRHPPLPPILGSGSPEIIPLPVADVVMGYMRKGAIEAFRKGSFFYCRTTDRDGKPLTLDISAAQGAFLLGWSGSLTGPYHTVAWMGRITSCRLVDKTGLKKAIDVTPSGDSVHYLLFRLSDITTVQPRDVSNLVAANNGSGRGGKFRTFQSTMGAVMSLAPLTVPPEPMP
jgi:predicted component of viral defense system (DUF524 family)